MKKEGIDAFWGQAANPMALNTLKLQRRSTKSPFANLPETGRARWGEILDAEKTKKCVWVRPELVAVIEFLEWTEADRLRHSKFVALRDDKNPREVVKEP